MSELSTAKIIAFRRPETPAQAAANAVDAGAPAATKTSPMLSPEPQVRLQLALAALDRAVNEQRTAVAKWRESLSELRTSLKGLGASLGSYNNRLGTLAEDVHGLNQEARRMEAIADKLLATRRATETTER